jgi:hypothetical protein
MTLEIQVLASDRQKHAGGLSRLMGSEPSTLNYFAFRAKLDIYVFYYYNCVDTSVGGLLVPEGIIHPVVSVST